LLFLIFQVSGRPVDLELARRQHADLVTAVRDLNIDVLELPPDETNALSVFTQDLAVVVNGIALMCRPVNSTRKPEVGVTQLHILIHLVWQGIFLRH
jgi:N-dimethylarginine dimethylaminohydrolase